MIFFLIYCITCTLCKKVYIGETGRRLGDRFREHLRDVEINDKDASKPVTRHFNLPNHSQKHMAVCGLSLHLGNTESRKNIEQKFIFQIGTSNLATLFYYLFYSIVQVVSTNHVAPPSLKNSIFHHYSLIHSDEGLTLETSVFESFTVANLPYRPCG